MVRRVGAVYLQKRAFLGLRESVKQLVQHSNRCLHVHLVQQRRGDKRGEGSNCERPASTKEACLEVEDFGEEGLEGEAADFEVQGSAGEALGGGGLCLARGLGRLDLDPWVSWLCFITPAWWGTD